MIATGQKTAALVAWMAEEEVHANARKREEREMRWNFFGSALVR